MTAAEHQTRHERISNIDDLVHQIQWHGQKHTLNAFARSDLNLTIPQMMTLWTIREQGVCCMSTLAELTRQSAGTLTGIVDRLIGEGLVERVRDPADRRIVRVGLTARGLDCLERVERIRHSETAELLDQFDEDELFLLEQFLFRIHSRVMRTQPSELTPSLA